VRPQQEKRVERRLAAIFAADVAGYSRLMSQDEAGTLRALAAAREVMDGLIAVHGGRIANTAGDSVLAEFPSAVDAVQCAVAVQEKLAAAADAEVAEDRRLQFRIGVHVGDVVIRGADLLGEGVNVAARLEGLAEPGGIAISGAAHGYVRKALRLAYTDLGEQHVKNLDEPVRAYAVKPVLAQAGEPSTSPSKPLPLPDRPSIAVLPFTNMSGDPEQDYFCDGLVEDIITALSHVPRLFVVARNSTFTYKDRAVNIRTVGQELGVRYVLEGSVRRSGDRLRLTGQLIDAGDGTHLWAERFDGRVQDIFDLQDDMTTRVVGAIAPRLETAEIERSKRNRPESLDAYDLYLRALAAVRGMTRESSDEALLLLERALKIDPEYAVAAGLGAWACTLRVAQNWPVNREAEKSRGVELGRIAVLKGQNDAEALAAGGYALAFLGGELHEGLRAIERAISLNPNSAIALSHAGWVRDYLGQPREAIEALERSIRLSPRDPALFRAEAALAYAHLLLGEFHEAITWGRRAIEGNPNYTVTYRALASALAHAGQLDEAGAVVARLTALVPDLSLRGLPEVTVFKHSGRLELILDGLRKAGLPE
jgi:adenylate cyclase